MDKKTLTQHMKERHGVAKQLGVTPEEYMRSIYLETEVDEKKEEMRNPTVRELIEKLSACDQDAVVCLVADISDFVVSLTSLEGCLAIKNVTYFDDNGDRSTGDVVLLSSSNAGK